MNLKNAQLDVDTWIKNHGVRYFNELTNMAQLTEEVGEVARIIARRYGEQSEKESDKNKDLGEELADVVFVVLCLANQTGVDLQDAFDKKMDLKTKRDHDRHQNNEKLKYIELDTTHYCRLVRSSFCHLSGKSKRNFRNSHVVVVWWIFSLPDH